MFPGIEAPLAGVGLVDGGGRVAGEEGGEYQGVHPAVEVGEEIVEGRGGGMITET